MRPARAGVRGARGTAYLRLFRAYSRGARLYLASAAVMGFTIFGGVYSLLMNLYLLRLGYGPPLIGLVHAVALLGWALACLPAGLVGRLLGSRRAMILGMVVSAVGHGVLPLVELFREEARPAWLIGTYLLGNVAIALYDVNSQPFLAEASTPRERDHLFSVQAALWPLAGFLGSLVGGVLPSLVGRVLGLAPGSPASYRYPLMLAAATIGAGVWAMSAARRLPPGGVGDAAGRSIRRAPAPAPRPPTLPRPRERTGVALTFASLGLAVLFQGTAEGAARTFFTVYMDTALHAATSRIGVLAAFGQLVAAPAALAMPAVKGLRGHRGVFVAGSLAMAVSLLPLALIPHWSAAGVGYMAVIAMASLARPAILVYLMQNAPAGHRATVSGVYTMAIGLSWAAVSLGGGYIIGTLGFRSFFLLAAAATACGALMFLRSALHGPSDRGEENP